MKVQGDKWLLEVGGQFVEADFLLPPQGENSELRSSVLMCDSLIVF